MDSLVAVGIIETKEVASAIFAADAAVKAADVTLIEARNQPGAKGMVVLTGDVGAVRAAMAAGVATIRKEGMLIAEVVIPYAHGRPLVKSLTLGSPGGPRPRTKGARPRCVPPDDGDCATSLPGTGLPWAGSGARLGGRAPPPAPGLAAVLCALCAFLVLAGVSAKATIGSATQASSRMSFFMCLFPSFRVAIPMGNRPAIA